MNPFRRKPRPELTNDAYARWLRAQRPPFETFLRLSELEQEALAVLGDEYVLSFAGEPPPEPAQADDVSAARTIAQGFADAIARRSGASRAGPIAGPSMGGLSARRTEAARNALDEHNRGRSILGRAPDRPEPTHEPPTASATDQA